MGKTHACKSGSVCDEMKKCRLRGTFLHKMFSGPQVSFKGKASAVSLLQLATFSGRCVLVRLLAFRDARLPLPKSLIGVLSDPRVLKVGVGCYEDGKRLVHDHGLTLECTVDLRYLALRQR